MSISGVQNIRKSDSTHALTSLLQTAQTSRDTTAEPDSLPSSVVSNEDAAHISKLARLFSKLQSLATDDPAKFKQITTDLAAKLNTEAAKIDGPQGQVLSKLAAKFRQAGQTGDVSVLRPQAAGRRVPAAYGTGSTEALSAAVSGRSSVGTSSAGSTDTVAALFQQFDQAISKLS